MKFEPCIILESFLIAASLSFSIIKCVVVGNEAVQDEVVKTLVEKIE